MKRTYVKLLTVAGLTGCFLFTSCRSAQETTARYEISKVEGNMITIDSTWDANPDKKATTVLKPYKDKVDAMMYEVIGTSEMKMDKGTPESLLSNLVASVLQEAAAQVLGKPADMGEGVSGIRLEINKKGELLNATIGGKPVVDDQLYTVATIDYLADGNGRMDAFLQAEKRECPEDATLRGLFLDYVRKQTAEGKIITSKLDGRITVK